MRFLIIFGIIIVAEFYSFTVIRSAVRGMPNGWRIGLMTLYIALTSISWLGIMLFRVINWSTMPHYLRNIYIATALGLTVGKVLILLVMLIDDLRRLVLWIINLFYTAGTKAPTPNASPEGGGIPRSVFLSRLALALGATALGGFLYGVTNRYNYHVRRIRLQSEKVPPAFRGLKIVQVSDIHSGSFDNHTAVAKGVQMILDEKPDLILFTGDLVNNKAEEVESYMEIFGRLKAPMGVYSTLGNHDYGDYAHWDSAQQKHDNLETLKAHHAALGWKLMMNEHVIFTRGNDRIALLGIENWSAKPQFPKYGDMRRAYDGLAAENVPFKILMSHDPSHWQAQVVPGYRDVQLTLSGHTHGMQFGIEIPGFKWSPVKYVYKEWAGLYQQGDQYLYVNRGFGFLGYPGRIGILPEITVIELS